MGVGTSVTLGNAARGGNVAEIAALLDAEGDPNGRDLTGHPALCEASRFGKIEAVKLLLVRRADVNAVSETNSTPLHYAATYSHVNTARILLEAKADVNAVSTHVATPAFKASEDLCNNKQRTADMMKLLISYLADVHVECIRERGWFSDSSASPLERVEQPSVSAVDDAPGIGGQLLEVLEDASSIVGASGMAGLRNDGTDVYVDGTAVSPGEGEASAAGEVELQDAAGGRLVSNQDCVRWVVVQGVDSLNVKEEKNVASQILGCKSWRDIVSGKREGAWIALAHEPGFLLAELPDGTKQLYPYDDVAEWIVLQNPGQVGLTVRKEKSTSSEILGRKPCGVVIAGRLEDDWVALFREPGFVLLETPDGTKLLASYDGAAARPETPAEQLELAALASCDGAATGPEAPAEPAASAAPAALSASAAPLAIRVREAGERGSFRRVALAEGQAPTPFAEVERRVAAKFRSSRGNDGVALGERRLVALVRLRDQLEVADDEDTALLEDGDELEAKFVAL